ncbi:hypothetical protein V6N11_027338 [Hibiscus sabdariffa]|uniref:Uncharacterized protein n=1 Tax=Hibiscus sabdariffa TaxID=183260 RepID=A0ABR2PGL6_9ROSI
MHGFMPPARYLVSASVSPPVRHLTLVSVSPPVRHLCFGQYIPEMSTRGDHPVRRRVRPVRLAEPLDYVPVDSPTPVNPSVPIDFSAPVDPRVSVDPPVHRDPSVPTDLLHVPDSGLATPAGGASTSCPELVTGVIDGTLSRQFLHLIQSVVRVADTVPETPISRTLISNGVRTFSGSSSGASTEAEAWLHDTERLVSSVLADRLTWEFFKERFQSRNIVPTEKDKCRKFTLGLRYELCKQVIPFQDVIFDVLVSRARDIEEIESLAPAENSYQCSSRE